MQTIQHNTDSCKSFRKPELYSDKLLDIIAVKSHRTSKNKEDEKNLDQKNTYKKLFKNEK